jgi:hypothetical protein
MLTVWEDDNCTCPFLAVQEAVYKHDWNFLRITPQLGRAPGAPFPELGGAIPH